MQVVNNSDAFQAPTGTGAVIFDYPKEQPLDILLKANADLDNWNKQKADKALQDQADRNKLLADIKFDTKGALDQDIRDVIQPAMNDAFDYYAKHVAPLDPSSSQYAQNAVQFKRMQANAENLVQESARHKEMFAEVNKPLNPAEVDVNDTQTATAMARALPLNQRIDYLKQNGSLIKPHKTSADEIIQEGIKQAMQHPTTVGDIEIKNVNGHAVSQENTETIPYDKALSFANGWLSNNYQPKGATRGFKDVIYNKYDEWMKSGVDANGVPKDPNAQFYFEKAQKTKGANGETYTPMEIYAADEIYKNNAKNIVRQNIGTDAGQQTSARLYAKGSFDAKQGGGLVDVISGVFQGKPQLFKPAKVTINGVEKQAVKTDALNSYSLGDLTISNDYGSTTTPNMILETIKGKDGKVYVKTTATFEKAKTDPTFAKFPYITYNNEAELYNAIGGGLPADKREKILNAGRAYLESKKANTGATSWDGAKIANVTPAEKRQMQEMFGMTTQNVPNPTTSAVPTQQQLKATAPKKTTKPKEDLRKKYNY